MRFGPTNDIVDSLGSQGLPIGTRVASIGSVYYAPEACAGAHSTQADGPARRWHEEQSAVVRRAWKWGRRRIRLIRERFVQALLNTGLRRRNPRMVACGLLIATTSLTRPSKPKGQVFHYVSLHNSGLVSDLTSAFSDTSDVRVSLIGQGYLKAIGSEFVGDKITDFSALSARHAAPDAFEDLVSFLTQVLKHYMSALKSTVFISGNFTYWMTYPLGAALDRCGRSLVIIHKEGLVSAWATVADGYRRMVASQVGPTTAKAIGVHSESTRKLIASAGVLPENRIFVIGASRLDGCHAFRTANMPTGKARGSHVVTFFTFPLTIGLWFPSDPRGPLLVPPHLRGGWRVLLQAVLEAARTIAASDPDLEVVVKSKSEPAKYPWIRALLESLEKDATPNLRVVSHGEGQSHLLKSSVVVGFNSTILLEAAAAGIPTVIPRFHEAGRHGAEPHILTLGSDVTICDSPDELVRRVSELARNSSDRPRALSVDQVAALEKFAGNSDGRSTQRLRRLLQDHHR